jgi:predicted O-methyltransferase YrrM
MATLNRVEGLYRNARRTTAALVGAPFNRWRYGRFGKYLTRARRIQGWTTTEEAAALMQTVCELPDNAVIVEVGSFLGKSAVVLAGACQLRGSGRVHCIDRFDGSGDAFSETFYREIAMQSNKPLRARFDRNIQSARLSDWVEIHQGSAEQVSAGWMIPIDMLYLDGDQSPAGARRAFEGFAHFFKHGAIVALHNSSARSYHEGHDGHRRLAVEVVQPPAFGDIVCVGSTTFARFLPQARPLALR